MAINQQGGTHYEDFAISPLDFISKNNLPFVEGNAIKYIVRHASKNGYEDLRKAQSYIDYLMQSAYAEHHAAYLSGESQEHIALASLLRVIRRSYQPAVLPTVIYSQGRGGAWAAAQVAYALDAALVIVEKLADLPLDADRVTLFVDDICDTGATISEVMMPTATLFVNNKLTIDTRPDFVGLGVDLDTYLDLPISQHQDITEKESNNA